MMKNTATYPCVAPGARGSQALPLRYARDLRPLAAIPLDAISSFGGTLLSRIPDMNQECPRRLVDPPASPKVPGYRRSKPKERGRSEVKRSRAGPPHGEPRTEPPSEAAEQDPRPLAVVPLVGGAPPFLHPGYALGGSPPGG